VNVYFKIRIWYFI